MNVDAPPAKHHPAKLTCFANMAAFDSVGRDSFFGFAARERLAPQRADPETTKLRSLASASG